MTTLFIHVGAFLTALCVLGSRSATDSGTPGQTMLSAQAALGQIGQSSLTNSINISTIYLYLCSI